MPDRFVSSSESFATKLRNNPLAVAGVAAFGGLLCGVVIVSALTSPPAKLSPSNAKAIETTGAAPQLATKVEPAASPKAPKIEPPAASSADNSTHSKASNNTAAANCQEQTWPYIARPCLANETGQPGKRGVRIISTDNLTEPVIGAVEAPPAAVTNRFELRETARQSLPPPQAMIAAPAVPAAPAVAAKPEITAATKPEPVARTSPSPTPSPTNLPIEPVVAMSPPSQPAQSAVEHAEPPQAAPEKPTRNKRKAKKQRPVPIDNAEETESGDRTVATSDPQPSSPGEQEITTDRRRQTTKGGTRGERPRIVERWIERDYDVPSASGSSDRRRVIVIKRGGGNYRSAQDLYYARHTERF